MYTKTNIRLVLCTLLYVAVVPTAYTNGESTNYAVESDSLATSTSTQESDTYTLQGGLSPTGQTGCSDSVQVAPSGASGTQQGCSSSSSSESSSSSSSEVQSGGGGGGGRQYITTTSTELTATVDTESDTTSETEETAIQEIDIEQDETQTELSLDKQTDEQVALTEETTQPVEIEEHIPPLIIPTENTDVVVVPPTITANIVQPQQTVPLITADEDAVPKPGDPEFTPRFLALTTQLSILTESDNGSYVDIGVVTQTNEPVLTGTVEPFALVTAIFRSTPRVVQTYADVEGQFAITIPAGLEAGAHSIEITYIAPGGTKHNLPVVLFTLEQETIVSASPTDTVATHAAANFFSEPQTTQTPNPLHILVLLGIVVLLIYLWLIGAGRPALARKSLWVLCIGICGMSVYSHSAFAAFTPDNLTYEGRLLNSSGTPITTAHTFRFSFWKSGDWVSGDASGGSINTGATNYGGWEEVQTVTPNSNGVFSIQLGSGTAITSINIESHKYLQVEVKTSGDPDTSYELIDPSGDSGSDANDRNYIGAVPYAKNSEWLNNRSVGSGSGNVALFGGGGSLTVSGSLTINSTNAAGDAVLTFGNALLPETLRFNADAHRFDFSDDLHIANNLTTSGSLTIQDVSRFKSDVSVNGVLSGATIHAQSVLLGSGSLSIEGDATFQGNLSFGDALSDAITSYAATWTFPNDTNFVLDGGVNALSFDTDTLSIDAANNRIGIRTTTPENPLEVVGTSSGTVFHANTSLRSSGSLTIENNSILQGNTTLGDSSADTITINAATWTMENDTNITLNGGENGLSFDTSTLSIDASTNRVGIGTTSPKSALEVRGTMSGESLSINGTTITGILSTTAVLDFPLTLTNTCSDLTTLINGAESGDAVTVTVDSAIAPINGLFNAWVSVDNTITIRYCAIGASVNISSGSYRIQVLKY